MRVVRGYFWGVLISLVFLVVGIITLSDYGINVDEPIHFIRGQAYLNFFLTGRKEYPQDELTQDRVSNWKIQQYNTSYFLEKDSGHPPLNGILAALSNKIFYEKLGILGDLESYHFFEIFVSSILIFLLYVMVKNEYGNFVGFVAALSLGLHPLFLGESHFNIKDPVLASFFAFTIYFFYLGIKKESARHILISSLFAALAFGTKFNAVFLPFVILPYILVRYGNILIRKGIRVLREIPKRFFLLLVLYPMVVLAVHYISRPYLWADPIGRLLEIFSYYKYIGTGVFSDSRFLIGGWNTYPAVFIAVSTPLVILFYFTIGIGECIFRIRREKSKFSALLLFWLLVPIVRVSWPGTFIYSGVRQIMEYVPAMAAISGLGALRTRGLLKKFNIKTPFASLVILLSFIPLIITLMKFHPNESVFMNSLIGGLRGAVEKKLPGAGGTMGNVYLQGVWWLNKNAEENARFGLPVGLLSNIPRQFLRPDIEMGPYFSGMKRDGEYMMEMISVNFPPPRYNFQYLDRFLNPVYQVEVDGVSLLKVWKNDKEHTKPGFLEEIEQKNFKITGGKKEGYLYIELENPAFLTKLEIDHGKENCLEEGSGDIKYSPDGQSEIHAPDNLFGFQGPYAKSLQTETHFVYFFPAVKTKWIHFIPADINLCLLNWKNIDISSLKNLRQ